MDDLLGIVVMILMAAIGILTAVALAQSGDWLSAIIVALGFAAGVVIVGCAMNLDADSW